MDTKIPKWQDRFNPPAVEQALYQHWKESGYFKPSENENAPSYYIAIPPPNVTGSLHVGHAFQQTNGYLNRFNRMEGHNTLWKAGQTTRVSLNPNGWWNVKSLAEVEGKHAMIMVVKRSSTKSGIGKPIQVAQSANEAAHQNRRLHKPWTRSR